MDRDELIEAANDVLDLVRDDFPVADISVDLTDDEETARFGTGRKYQRDPWLLIEEAVFRHLGTPERVAAELRECDLAGTLNDHHPIILRDGNPCWFESR